MFVQINEASKVIPLPYVQPLFLDVPTTSDITDSKKLWSPRAFRAFRLHRVISTEGSTLITQFAYPRLGGKTKSHLLNFQRQQLIPELCEHSMVLAALAEADDGHWNVMNDLIYPACLEGFRRRHESSQAPRANKSASGSSSESSWMEGRAGDGSSWFDQVTCAEAGPGACKRKKTNTKQQAPDCPFPLISEEARKEVMGIIYEHAAGQEPSQKNIALRAISAYYPDFTLATVMGVESQVLCMIAEYHLACATMGSTTMSPILPEAVEQYLPPLVDYAHPGGTGLTDVRFCDHKSRSLHVGVWLH